MPAQGRPQHAPPRTVQPRRRHPARTARLAAIGMSIASAAGLTAFFDRTPVSGQAVGARVLSGAPTSSTAVTPTAPVTDPSSVAPTTTASTLAPTTTVRTRSAVVDGGISTNEWGDVQVQVVFGPDGAIRSANAIRTPDSHGRSIEINDQAVPILDQEAVDAQSARIDSVSGATYTSESYQASLQSAIDAARQAGVTQLH